VSSGNRPSRAFCRFGSKAEKAQAIIEFLDAHGDDIPREVLEKRVPELVEDYALRCNEDGEIIGTALYEDIEFYLCEMKHLAVREDYQRRGIGSELTREIFEKAKADNDCAVILTDITFDNIGSKKTLRGMGFEDIGDYCFNEGGKPADLYILVRFPPENGKCKRKNIPKEWRRKRR